MSDSANVRNRVSVGVKLEFCSHSACWIIISAEIFFSREQVLTFYSICILKRQFARNVKACFLGKIAEVSICHLLN